MKEAKKYLQEAKRIIDMSSSEYLDEILKEHPEDKGIIGINDVWAHRTGVIEVLIDSALRELQN
jgi:hypothetical protein